MNSGDVLNKLKEHGDGTIGVINVNATANLKLNYNGGGRPKIDDHYFVFHVKNNKVYFYDFQNRTTDFFTKFKPGQKVQSLFPSVDFIHKGTVLWRSYQFMPYGNISTGKLFIQ